MGVFDFLSTHKVLGAGIFVGVVLTGALVFVGTNKVSPVSWGWFGAVNQSKGIALDGFDPVSYHQGSTPARGSAEWSWNWRGVEWRFLSAANLSDFKSAPERYAPQFGGFCAFAVSKGFTAHADPEAWLVEDGKLYVFASEGVKTKWGENLGESVAVSERSWARRPQGS